MDLKLIERIKKFIKTTAIERKSKKIDLVLYGGEPFLLRAKKMGINLTNDIAKWAGINNIEFRLNVLSNGSLIDESVVKWLNNFDTRLQIPVDGDSEMHNKYRYYLKNNKGSFDDITRVLAMTKNTNIDTHIRISLTDETYPTMESLLDELKSRGLTHVYPDFCYITAFTDACMEFESHTLSDLKLFKVMPELWKKAYKKGFPLDIRPQIKPLPCSSISDGSFIIDPFGEVYKCWELVGLKEHVVGYINSDGTLDKTLVYGKILERDPLSIDKCKQHSYLPACGGGCVCKAYWRNGTYHSAGCGTEKFLLKDKIKMYIETINNNKPELKTEEMLFQKIEGRQTPYMSHCYVLV